MLHTLIRRRRAENARTREFVGAIRRSAFPSDAAAYSWAQELDARPADDAHPLPMSLVTLLVPAVTG